MPAFDVRRLQHVVVAAPPGATFAAIDRLDFTRDRLVAAVGAVRMLPARIRGHPGAGSAAEPTEDYKQFADMWTPLAEEPGQQKLLGLVGALWQRDVGLIKLAAEEFAAFDRPGVGKVALGYLVTPYGPGSILTVETRVALTDDVARRRFGRYWLFIGPGARFTTARMLRLIKADAEAAS
jgi:hypothetical protein